jgi:hypothetical protein
VISAAEGEPPHAAAEVRPFSSVKPPRDGDGKPLPLGVCLVLWGLMAALAWALVAFGLRFL